jgi:ComF family protein
MFAGLFKGLRELIYPKTCLACKSRIPAQDKEEFICSACQTKIEKNFPPFCVSCGRKLEKKALSKNICANCSKKNLEFDRAFSPCVYTGVVKTLIHEFKYNGKDYLSKPLAGLISDFIKEYDLPIEDLDMIIPIPLHKSKAREREFNQAELLAENLGETFHKQVANGLLKRHKQTRTQTTLKEELRFSNVKNSFSLNQPQAVKDKHILLVDDVLTTGATSSEAARILKSAGANLVFVITLAN